MTIFEAIAAGDQVLLDSLIAGGADVRARDDSGLTALHVAAGRGDLDAARALLDAGAGPDARSLEPAAAAPTPPLQPGVTVADLSTREGAAVLGGLFGAIWEASKPKPGPRGHTPLADAAVGVTSTSSGSCSTAAPRSTTAMARGSRRWPSPSRPAAARRWSC